MSRTRPFIVRLISIMPRQWLETELSNDARPWMLSRDELEARVLLRDGDSLREALLNYCMNHL